MFKKKKNYSESDHERDVLDDRETIQSAKLRMSRKKSVERVIPSEEELSKKGRGWIWFLLVVSVGVSYALWRSRGF